MNLDEIRKLARNGNVGNNLARIITNYVERVEKPARVRAAKVVPTGSCCEGQCEERGRGELAWESSRTRYPPDKCGSCNETADHARHNDDGSKPHWHDFVDPNADLLLCRDCAAEHHEHWDAKWAEYNAGLL